MNTSATSSSATTSTASVLDSAINPGVQAVVELFDTDLLTLKFPDVDQAVLREAAERVLAQAETVAAAEQALALAREGLSDAQEVLLNKCQRALAYARVYAEEDRELSRKLDAISLPRPRTKAAPPSTTETAEPKPGRRGRRSAPTSGPLFLEPAGSAAVSEEAATIDSCAA